MLRKTRRNTQTQTQKHDNFTLHQSIKDDPTSHQNRKTQFPAKMGAFY